MEIRPFEPDTAPESELRAAHQLSERIRIERNPNNPPTSYEQYTSNLASIPSSFHVTFWRAWTDTADEMIAQASAVTTETEENTHLAQVDIGVLPEYRRQGLGTHLLGCVNNQVTSRGRRLVLLETTSTIPAGEAFARRIGATVGLEGHVNELDLNAVDRELMRSWITRAQQRAAGFELDWWLNGYPEERLQEVADLLQMFNSQPKGELDVEDFVFTPEQAREMDEANRQRGITRWTCYAREQSTGRIVGFTEISIVRSQPEKLEQGLTAVLPHYQNRGIGRWLKAAVIEKVLNDLPEARTISTGNADINEPMVNINRAMGFRPAISNSIWQASTDAIERYLREKANSTATF